MAKVSVYDMTGAVVSDLELNDNIFGIEPNTVVMHAAVVNYLANQRQGTQSTLTRTEVSGGGKKPWRQKGTGHARQGSTRAPQWTHGGVALGPKPRSYTYSLNKKVKRLALKSALSAKVQDGSMIVVDSITADEFKTKTIVNMLKALSADKALIVLNSVDEKVIKSAANIPGVKTTQANTLNVYDILKYNTVVATKAAVAEGIVAGGGTALINAMSAVEKLIPSLDGDEKTGAKIVLRALEAPLRQIAANAGLEGSIIVDKIRRSRKVGYGFDAYNETYCDMMSNGIVDPTKVTRSALQNAASIASMVLTTESAVANIPKEEPAAAAPAAGGMGGMY